MTKERPTAPAPVLSWGLVIATCMVAIPFLGWPDNRHLFLTCVTIATCAYVRTLFLLDRFSAGSRQALLLGLGLAALWRVPLLLKPPTLSSDVYRYVFDGRIQRLGYNPYVVVPADHPELHTAETRLMNHLRLPTPYPPAAELFFRAVMAVHESARAMKLALAICDAATACVLLLWLIDSGRNPWWVLAYAWNPLVSLEGAGNGHVDLLGALCLVTAAFSLSRGRRAIAALTLALGIAVKFLPAVLLPLFWRRIGIRDGVLALALLSALYLPFIGSGGALPIGSLGAYLTWWRINGPLYGALEHILPKAALVALPAAAGFAVAVWARRHWAIDSPAAWAWPAAVALLFAPTVFPWYLLWLTPFLFARSTLPLAVWSVAALVTYSSLPAWAAGTIEYGAVAIAAALAIFGQTDRGALRSGFSRDEEKQ
jgi:hypothetical protein